MRDFKAFVGHLVSGGIPAATHVELDALLHWLADRGNADAEAIEAAFSNCGVAHGAARQLTMSYLDCILFGQDKDCYQLFGLDPHCDFSAIRYQHKKMLQVFHPDRHPQDRDWFTKRTEQLNKAYAYLKANHGTRTNTDRQSSEVKDRMERPASRRGRHHNVPRSRAWRSLAVNRHKIRQKLKACFGSSNAFERRVYLVLFSVPVILVGFVYVNQSESTDQQNSAALPGLQVGTDRLSGPGAGAESWVAHDGGNPVAEKLEPGVGGASAAEPFGDSVRQSRTQAGRSNECKGARRVPAAAKPLPEGGELQAKSNGKTEGCTVDEAPRLALDDGLERTSREHDEQTHAAGRSFEKPARIEDAGGMQPTPRRQQDRGETLASTSPVYGGRDPSVNRAGQDRTQGVETESTSMYDASTKIALVPEPELPAQRNQADIRNREGSTVIEVEKDDSGWLYTTKRGISAVVEPALETGIPDHKPRRQQQREMMAIRTLLNQYQNAYNISNIERLSQLFHKDAETKYAKGKSEIQENYMAVFDKTSRRELVIEEPEIGRLHDRQYKVSANYVVNWTYPNGEQQTQTGRLSMDLVAVGDGVRIRRLEY